MQDDMKLIATHMVNWLSQLWQGIGGWGMIGAFIIGVPILRKIVLIMKNLWKGGL